VRKTFVTVSLLLTAGLCTLVLTGASNGQEGVARITPIRTTQVKTVRTTYQGKDIRWWSTRAVANRKEANAARREIKRLRRSMLLNLSIEESVLLATTAYPSVVECHRSWCPRFTEARAWCLIRHESWDGTKASLLDFKPTRAVNRTAIGNEHATGLFQFLPSTFRSTPFGRYNILSAYAQAMAAGWMHAHGRGAEWSTCRF